MSLSLSLARSCWPAAAAVRAHRPSIVCCASSAEVELLQEMQSQAARPPAPRTSPELEALRAILEDGAGVDNSEEAASLSPMLSRAATDGQLLEEGVEQLLDALCMPADAVFLDLGSGDGRALFHAAARTPLAAATGVELLESRHAVAEATLARTAELLQAEDVRVVRGDLSDLGPECGWAEAARLREVTHAFSCSVCFDDFLLRRMAATLGDAQQCPHFQALVSIRALPSQPHLAQVGELELACSWNAQCRARVYVPTDVLRRAERSVPVLARFLCADGTCALPLSLSAPERLVRLPD